MKKILLKHNLLPLICIFLVSSCNGGSKDDFDLSDIKLPKNFVTKQESKEEANDKKNIEIVKNELKPFQDKKDIMDSVKFGKKDPFSISESNTNSSISKINLKGFISIDNKTFVMINYKEKEGALSIDSIGGINTTLLPEGAIIKEINPLGGYITINFEDELYKLPLKN